MSLRSEKIGLTPEETRRQAHGAFAKGDKCLRLHDAVGMNYDDALVAGLFSQLGQHAESPWCSAWVCVLQYVERLTDGKGGDSSRHRLEISVGTRPD